MTPATKLVLMLAAPYVEAIGRMDRRFVTTSVVPTLIFTTAYGAVLVHSLWSFAEASSWLSGRPLNEQLLLSLLGGAVVWFISGLMASNWRKIVRLYEGYPLSRWLDRGTRRPRIDRRNVPGIGFHLKQKSRLKRDPAQYYLRYPRSARDKTLPTTIGNVLLAGERYGLDRYGFETNLLWTRFAWCLPEKHQISLEQFKEEHQLPLALSFTAATFSWVSGITILLTRGSPGLFVLTTGLGVALAVAAYLLAIERTEEYAEQLRATIDLHHTKLRDVWAGTIPDEDMEFWFHDAKEFVLQGQQGLDSVREARARQQTDQESPPEEPILKKTTHEVLEQQTRPESRPEPTSDLRQLVEPRGRSVPRSASGVMRHLAASLYAEHARRSWRWWCRNVRLLWMVSMAAGCLIAVGALWLSIATRTVLVASEGTGTANLIGLTTKQVNSSTVPRDAITDRTEPRIARHSLQPGEVVTESNSFEAASVATMVLPTDVPTGLEDTEQAFVLVAPCGVLLEGVLVTPVQGPDGESLTVVMPDKATNALEGCAPTSATVLRLTAD